MSETQQGFYFDYDVDKEGRLCRVIWIDETAKKNYEVLGEAVSYDPTYKTNKYFLLFTPFTGIDHHKRSVTFCGALIAHEDFESFNWVFKRFLDAMNGKEPEYIITDQDPAIIKSVGHIFKTARHRFCMWHIMSKVPGKYGVTKKDYPDFMKKLNAIVWDEDIEPNDFDERWCEIMSRHSVGQGDWFAEAFNIRGQWIMAHCRCLKMGGIMKTTQRSESENSYFKRFEDKSGTLVEFWTRFESAMEQQRHTQTKLDHDSRHSFPTTISQLPIERHGAKLYTHAIFVDFQYEVKLSMTTCSVGGFSKISGLEITTVEDALRGRSFVVEYNAGTNEANCTCRLFELKGLLCRHIIWIYSGKRQQTIPDFYIKKRWTKNVLVEADSIDHVAADGKRMEMTRLWYEFHNTVTLLGTRDKSVVESLSTLIREFRTRLSSSSKILSKNQELERMLGCSPITEVSILPPKQCKNKGSGIRLVSNKAKCIAVAAKQKRRCKNCKQMSHHDRRNCPNPFADTPPTSDDESGQSTDVEEEDNDESEE